MKFEDNDVVLFRKIALVLILVFIVLFLVCSFKIFDFSERRPDLYAVRYEKLNTVEKGVVTTMKETGSIESSIGSLSTSRRSNDSGYNIFDDISKKHK